MPTYDPSPSSKTFRIVVGAIALAASALGIAPSARAQTENTVYNFGVKGGPYDPYSGVVLDKSGNLYGVTPSGGSGQGVVYKLAPVSGGWQVSVLYTFTGGTDGGSPYTTPVFDANGNLYGTAQIGGSSKAGVVYELSPTSGGQWQETVLYSFTGKAEGGYPAGNLVFDKAGNLYGSNVGGGNITSLACQNTGGCGAIFELSPAANGKWRFHLLHVFSGNKDGVGPAQLTFDAAGNLFGSAAGAWQGFELPSAPGLVFRLTPTTSGRWKESPVYLFGGGADGGLPSGVIFDKAGNMYGTGADGGLINNCQGGYTAIGCGVVFKISHATGGGWKETVLYAFTGGSDGSGPDAGVVFDKGNLYGPTLFGGAYKYGVIFELSPGSGGVWNETVAYAFNSTEGSLPDSTLVTDGAGNLYGTTIYGGANSAGVAFELTP